MNEDTRERYAAPKPRITVNKYETPTASNREAPFSVGIMNLTATEANLISEYASVLQNDRSNAVMSSRLRQFVRPPRVTADVYGSPAWEARNKVLRDEAFAELTGDQLTATETRAREEAKARRALALKEAYLEEMKLAPDDKRRYLTGTFGAPGASGDSGQGSQDRTVEPPAPRNRFSGLDIE